MLRILKMFLSQMHLLKPFHFSKGKECHVFMMFCVLQNLGVKKSFPLNGDGKEETD